jgi:hypothetical protein
MKSSEISMYLSDGPYSGRSGKSWRNEESYSTKRMFSRIASMDETTGVSFYSLLQRCTQIGPQVPGQDVAVIVLYTRWSGDSF